MSKLVLSGDTSGSVTLDAPAVSGTTTLTLPTTSGTVVVTSGAQTIEFADGSASTPSITNSGDTNTGMFFPAADTIAFAEGGTEAMRLNSSGNVGIGQTSPLSKLDIIVNTADGDGIKVTNNNNSAYFTLNTNGATGYGVTGWANSTVLESVPASTGGLVLGSYTGNITFQTARTERMRIASAGQIGIGGANYGTSGQVLTSGGASAAPSWTTISTTPTTAQVLSAMAGANNNDVGTYAWLGNTTTSTGYSPGTNYAGSGLGMAGASDNNSNGTWISAGQKSVFTDFSGGALSGTWKCMGGNGGTAPGVGRARVTLFLRVA